MRVVIYPIADFFAQILPRWDVSDCKYLTDADVVGLFSTLQLRGHTVCRAAGTPEWKFLGNYGQLQYGEEVDVVIILSANTVARYEYTELFDFLWDLEPTNIIVLSRFAYCMGTMGVYGCPVHNTPLRINTLRAATRCALSGTFVADAIYGTDPAVLYDEDYDDCVIEDDEEDEQSPGAF